MEVTVNSSVVPSMLVLPCRGCGRLSSHHPYVKPSSPRVGLVCSRCGRTVQLEEDYGTPKVWLSDLELTGEHL
jgi:hypothetical protein